MRRKLTHKQLKFCHKFIENNGNAANAYRQVYNTQTDRKQTVNIEAWRLMNNPYVTQSIQNIQENIQEKLVITVDTQVRKLQNVYEAAYSDKEYSPAIAAINSQSKHLGLIQDKPLTTVNIHMAESEDKMRLVSPEKRQAMLEILRDKPTT